VSIHFKEIIAMNSSTKAAVKMQALLSKIALEHCSVETLQTRRSDQLDFHEVSVWVLKSALQAAYEAGVASANATSLLSR
jgi:hypothetical protein